MEAAHITRALELTLVPDPVPALFVLAWSGQQLTNSTRPDSPTSGDGITGFALNNGLNVPGIDRRE